MRKRSRFLIAFICIMLVAGTMLTGCGGGSTTGPVEEDGRQVWNMRLSTQNPVDFSDSLIMAWAVQEIYDRSDGALNITHFPAGALGDYIPIFEEVMQGTVDIIVGTAPTTVDPMMAMVVVPYLITSYEVGGTVWTEGSNFFEMFDGVAANNNLKFLGVLPGGLMGIGMRVPLNPDTVWDFDQPTEEHLIRLPPLWILQSLADGMQVRTTAIPFADLYPALMTGVVDGWIGGGPELNYVGFRDAINYFYDFRYMDDSFSMFMNRDLYYSLPVEYQRIISDVFTEASMNAIEAQTERSEYFIQQLIDYGIEVHRPTQVQRDNMREAAIRRIWPGLRDNFGDEVMDRLMQDVM